MVGQGLTRSLVIGSFKGRCGIVTALQDAGFAVIEATECVRGLKHVLDLSPHIVIIYEGKTLRDGIRLLRALKCVSSAPILVVGSGNEDSVVRSLLQGADAYFPVSWGIETLSSYIHALLSRN